MATEGITSPGLMRVNWCKNNERGGGLFFRRGTHAIFSWLCDCMHIL